MRKFIGLLVTFGLLEATAYAANLGGANAYSVAAGGWPRFPWRFW